MVNHPSHYNSTSLECIDAIMAATDEGFEYYLQGNIMKYLWRYRYKNGIQDLKKAQWYLAKLIEHRKTQTMLVKVKLFLTLEVDTDEFHGPADGDVGIELEDGLYEFLHEIEGVEIKHSKSITE
jgi:hypothetical protein